MSTRSRAHATQQEKPWEGEACAPQLESSLLSLQLEIANVQLWRPSTDKNKYINIKNLERNQR